ncbi:MAG: hypothetical protein MPJ52_01415 [Alphaproteobacteria bacterium]|nr:hypothetical protein [Alphaproteobacteria bacterium]
MIHIVHLLRTPLYGAAADPHLAVSIIKNQDGRGRASCERYALARASRRRGLRPRDECAYGARFNLSF